MIRPLEVYRDRLPDAVADKDFDVFLEAPPAKCHPETIPPASQILGIKVLAPEVLAEFQPYSSIVCKQLASRLLATPQAGRVRVQWHAAKFDRAPKAVAAALKPRSTGARYLVAVRWRAEWPEFAKQVHWHTEELAIDAQTDEVVWHAMRRIDGFAERTEAHRPTVASQLAFGYLQEQLAASLGARGKARQFVALPTGAWDAAAATADPVPADRARVVFVNRFSYGLWDAFNRRAVKWFKQGDAPVEIALPHYTFASALVPPGTYTIDPLGRAPVRLEAVAGQTHVVAIVRALLNDTAIEFENVQWWDQQRKRAYAHAFLEDAHVPHPSVAPPWFKLD